MKITNINILKFRGFRNESFELGSQLTAIAGQNGTQKSTLLGIITQAFTISSDSPMRSEKPLCGGSYISAFKDKFRLSPVFDKPKEHEWTIVYDDRSSFTLESIKRAGSPNIRFWKKGARNAGDGYCSFPTIFLSLKRLVPLAEEQKITVDNTVLTENELTEFKHLHNKILISQIPIQTATSVKSKNKQSIGVSTELYDWNQNSMGQDNLGKIILALFSFQRLKNKYPDSYKGGILAIDELDATMYPASQVELLSVLRSYASRLNLQIIFTTHSITLLKATDDYIQQLSSKEETKNQIKIAYLKRIDNTIKIKQDINFRAIQLDLNVVANNPLHKKQKIIVYTEDAENIKYVKAILKTKASILEFVKIPMPCSTLVEMVNKKVPAFLKPFAMIILDGDVRTNKDKNKNKTYMKKIQAADNILILPGNISPERLLAKFLYNLSDASPVWGDIAEGYNKQVCFREYQLDEINASGEPGRQKAKEWFNSQLQYWGKDAKKVLNPLLGTMTDEVNQFKEDFKNMIKGYIHD